MSCTSPTRASLIREGLKVMITNGYDGVGLGAILDAAGVPKGSFYHFFSSKEEFAGEVINAYDRHYIELRDELLGDRSQSPLQRLANYFDELERIHREETPLGGCLYGVLAQTVAVRSPAFRDKLAAVFATWNAQLKRLLDEAKAAGEVAPRLDTQDAAAFLIEAYEGALIRMKVDGDFAAFRRFRLFALGSLSL